MSSLEKINDRESNFELLRIIATIMMLVLHVNCHFGVSPAIYIANHPLDAFFQQFFEIFSYVGVNVFVLISGWFGIKPSVKGFTNLCFQIFFITLLTYFIMLSLGLIPSSSIYKSIGVIWFVWAYLLLYIISPVLNVFIQNSSKRQYRIFLLSFFLFMTLCGWLLPLNGGFDDGYSTMSFIFLYLLARYIHLYHYDVDRHKIDIFIRGGGANSCISDGYINNCPNLYMVGKK